jgi:hypothetical protein
MGEKIEGSGSNFWNLLWQLLSPLNMEHVFISSYSWVIFFYLSHTNSMFCHTFLFQSKSALNFCHIICLVLIESMFPSQLSCFIMFKGSFTSNHPSKILPIYVSCVIPYTFDSPSHVTLLSQFHVDDGRYIKALLRRVFSYRLHQIIWELDLETS